MCGYKIQVLYLLPTTLHTFVSDTGRNINVFSTIPHCSARFPSPLLSLFLPLPLPLRHRNLPQALHLSGLSACFFIWLVATGGSTLADYNSAASHFRFIRAPASPPHTHTPCLLPFLYPTSASILTTLTSVSPDNTAIPHHTAAVRTSTLPSCLPPSISSTSISAENLAPETKKKKKWGKKEILWQWKHLSWRGSSSCIITWASVTGDDPGEWRISIACHSRHSADCIDKACRGL